MIDIVMATFNGEKYIKEQLDSILAQTFTDWRLIISDDCSKDKTVIIVKEYQNNFPGKIILIENTIPSGSAQNNFYNAVKYATADYIMFADQDDVWLPRKIEETFYVMKELEKRYGNDTPLLVHTDLKVVDETLSIINDSIFNMQNMDWQRCKFNNLLVQNIVTGCTILGNKKLFSYMQTIPKHAVMHDMWIALIASAFGHIGFLNKSTILYRQHGKNANGAKDVKSLKYLLYKVFHSQEIHDNLVKQYKQAEEFVEIFNKELSPIQIAMLNSYGSLENKNPFEKYKELKRYSLFKNSYIQKLGQILR